MAIRNVDLTSLVPPDQLALAQKAIAGYWATPWYLIFLSALERTLALPVQICFSVLVLQTFIRRQSRWIYLAIGYHALVDGAAVFVLGTWGVYAAEAAVSAFCLLSLLVIFALRQPEPQAEQEQPELIPPPPPLRPIDFDQMETTEKLDETRYL
jgi:uncharacterized membrane protein YhfC